MEKAPNNRNWVLAASRHREVGCKSSTGLSLLTCTNRGRVVQDKVRSPLTTIEYEVGILPHQGVHRPRGQRRCTASHSGPETARPCVYSVRQCGCTACQRAASGIARQHPSIPVIAPWHIECIRQFGAYVPQAVIETAHRLASEGLPRSAVAAQLGLSRSSCAGCCGRRSGEKSIRLKSQSDCG